MAVSWCGAPLSLAMVILVIPYLITCGHGHGHVHGVGSNVDPHGGVPMGHPSRSCDDGKWNTQIDWDASLDFEYTCQPGELSMPDSEPNPCTSCIPKDKIPLPLHICMDEAIEYSDQPPRAGKHRPLWPVYGEYIYVPPQRWIHSLEHGGVVFLYHPCADPVQIENFKQIAKQCLWKHIITPYRNMSTPYAILTYGCRLTMNAVDRKAAISYIKEYALKGPEGTFKDGQYKLGLLDKANIVSDSKDSQVCPGPELVEDNSKRINDLDIDLDMLDLDFKK